MYRSKRWIGPWSAWPQAASSARVAIEGYVDGQLIGGIVQDVLVPKATNFDGQLHVYLPEVVR